MRRPTKKRLTRLHRALEGEGPQPFAYYLGRLCEEFHCLPSAAWRELQRVPVGLLEEVIEMRAYAHTKAAYDQRQNPKRESPMWQLVKQIDFDLAQEALRARAE